MGDLEDLERRIKFDHLLWDRQIEVDSKAGKLDKLAAEALADYKAGRAREA